MVDDLSDKNNPMLRVARGERPWSALQSIGVKIKFENGYGQMEVTPDQIGVARWKDVAHGFLVYRNKPHALREWAFVTHEIVDIVPDDNPVVNYWEDHPVTDFLYEALFDASFGNPLSEATWNQIEQLAKEEKQ